MDNLNFDKNHIWHPYTSTTNPLPVFYVKSAKGVYLKLKNGKKLIDGMSSWWSVIHGYNNKELNKAAKDQLNKMSHIMFGGLTHQPAIDLAKKLIEITPSNLQKIFFSDSGSVSVEVAIKMAIQYWQSKKQPQKNKLLTIKSGYHGDTFKAMSVCDPETGMHHIFNGSMPQNYFAEQPKIRFSQKWDSSDILSIKTILEDNNENIAAVILEPIVQGAGGMWFYSPQYLNNLRNLCNKHNVLLIFDEIATGFGRTGKLFATNYTNIQPDIMCLGKALTGGYLSLAATLTTSEIAKTISQGEAKVFMHGPTFMANPLACAIANTNIELLFSYDWENKIKNIENQLNNELNTLKTNTKVNDVRILGAIGVVEMKEPVNMAILQQKFVDLGVWIRPFGKLIYLMPPYIIKPLEITKLTKAIKKVID
jgi:adenosylmethionine-8-amino-7-oxononanoate aminotransferase